MRKARWRAEISVSAFQSHLPVLILGALELHCRAIRLGGSGSDGRGGRAGGSAARALRVGDRERGAIAGRCEQCRRAWRQRGGHAWSCVKWIPTSHRARLPDDFRISRAHRVQHTGENGIGRCNSPLGVSTPHGFGSSPPPLATPQTPFAKALAKYIHLVRKPPAGSSAPPTAPAAGD